MATNNLARVREAEPAPRAGEEILKPPKMQAKGVNVWYGEAQAIKDAEKFFGRTVILAARIASQAAGGEILASSILRDLTRSLGDLRFGAEREVELKGIAEPQRLVRVEWD